MNSFWVEKKIALLRNVPSLEREISLRSNAAVSKAPARLTLEESRIVQKTALAAHPTDAIPGMTETSLLSKAAAAVGISMPKLGERIDPLSVKKRSG